MTEIEVKVQPSYKVYIAKGGLKSVAAVLPLNCHVLIVTDSNVARLYLDMLTDSLQTAGYTVRTFSFDAGEQSKNIATYLRIVEALASNKFTRRDMVVALGGGVVGDIAGFAAATYMRGIKVVQVPTTLLAMIDSSVGGKTGIDLPQGKNLLGAFHQPSAVIADLQTLDTLPEYEWQCGFGEGIKYACLMGGELAELMMSGISGDAELERFIELCVQYKAEVVAADERESGKRKLLNFGHTLGHAIECESGYTVPHGVAVAKGVLLMAKAACNNRELSSDKFDKISALAAKYGVDIDGNYDMDALLRHIRYDKKANSQDNIDVIKIRDIGDCYVDSVGFVQFEEYLKSALK